MKLRRSILLPGLIYISFLVTILILILFLRDSGGATLILLASIGLIIVIAGILYFLFIIYQPVMRLKHLLGALAASETIQPDKSKTFQEFKEIELSLEEHLKRLKEIKQVVNNLSEGTIDDDFDLKGEYDELGQALLVLKQSIIRSNMEAQKRQKLDEQQNWSSRGIARFGQLLRDFDQNVSELSSTFIRELVSYLDMEVGGLFLLHTENDKQIFRLTGAYAFDREKIVEKQFEPGEGLVGRCALEKRSIIITDIPDDYIRIRSGMGEDKPSTIILVPILFDLEVLGVIELATFSIVKKYKIDFLESLGKNIASSISKAGMSRD